jgi:hypothetical protein
VFTNIKIIVSSIDMIPLSDGTFKKAKDITLDDNILDSWILENTVNK